MDDEDAALTAAQKERLEKFIAHMNVFSQHKKVMAEAARPKKEAEVKTKK